MIKRFFSICIAVSMTLTILTACNKEPSTDTNIPDKPEVVDPIEPDEPVEPIIPDIPEKPVYTETTVGEENTLTSKGETVTLTVIENKLYITNLSTLSSNVNLVTEDSVYTLPRYGKIDGKRIELLWEFDSAVKYENKTVNNVLTEGLIYKFKETTQNLTLKVYCVIRPKLEGAVEIYSEIENLNESEYRIEPSDFASITVKIDNAESSNVVRIKREGFIAEGFVQNGAEEQGFENGIVWPGSGMYVENIATSGKLKSCDCPNMQENTFYLAQFIDLNSQNGVFFALNWTIGRVWSKSDAASKIELKASLTNDGNFETEINPGETFLFPSILIVPYDGDIDDGSNKFKKWFFECKSPEVVRENENLPYLQFDGVSPSYAKEHGIESVKWDYGWWFERSQYSGDLFEGAWTLGKIGHSGYLSELAQLGCSDLKDYGDLMEKEGLNWTLYAVLHDTHDENNQVTDQYGELNSIDHPEWFSSHSLTPTSPLLVDLGSIECVEFLKNSLHDLFANNNVKTWRTDFVPIVHKSAQENRHDANGTDVGYWCTVGFAEIIDHLYDTVDGFMYESCSMGGGDKCIYLAEKAVVFNCDDTANYLSLRTSFYDSSYIIHPAQLQMPMGPDKASPYSAQYWPKIDETNLPEDFDLFDEQVKMAMRTGIICSFNMPQPSYMDGGDYSEYFKEYTAIYKEKVRPLVRYGSLYHILPRPDGKNWDGVMYADPDSENNIKGVVFLFKPSAEVSDTYKVIFEGLYEDTVYKLTFEDRPEQNCTATGSELMTNGINVEIKNIGSELIWITEAE